MVSWNAPGQSIVPAELDMHKTLTQAEDLVRGKGETLELLGNFLGVFWDHQESLWLAPLLSFPGSRVPLLQQRHTFGEAEHRAWEPEAMATSTVFLTFRTKAGER